MFDCLRRKQEVDINRRISIQPQATNAIPKVARPLAAGGPYLACAYARSGLPHDEPDGSAGVAQEVPGQVEDEVDRALAG